MPSPPRGMSPGQGIPSIAATPNGYIWVAGEEAHELFLAFATVHVRRVTATRSS